MRLRIFGASDVGAVRERNEDAFLIGQTTHTDGCCSVELRSTDPHFERFGLLAAVADGMGGYRGGAAASRIALETLARTFHEHPNDRSSIDALAVHAERCLLEANRALCVAGERDEELAEAGTTIVGIAMLPSGEAVVFHAGDSRAFRTSAGLTRALTIDHTPVARRIEQGEIAEEVALRMPRARHLTNAMGCKGRFAPEITTRFRFGPGDRALLVSDGVSAYGGGLDEEELRELLRQPQAVSELTPRILLAAEQEDGSDNLTAVLMDIFEDEHEGASEPAKNATSSDDRGARPKISSEDQYRGQ